MLVNNLVILLLCESYTICDLVTELFLYHRRLFWIITVIVSLGLMLLILRSSYYDYEQKAVSFVTETTYLDWNTTFPAVTLCPIAGSEPEWDDDEEFIKEEIDLQKLFISDLVYFTGSCYSCVSECKSCQAMNFTEKVEKYRKRCPRIMSSCRWNNVIFNCCEELLPLETEYGYCYSFNSMHTQRSTASKLDLTMNRRTGPGELWLQTNEDVRVYFHAPEDVPFINSDPDQRKDVMLGESFNISINVIEINNDDNVKDVPIYKRGCRFPWEYEGITVHEYYSYSTCVVQCHAENHISLCNCTHHLMPSYNKIKYCNMDGLRCLTENFETVNRLHAKGAGSEKPGLVCDCLPSCTEPEYNVVSDTKGTTSSSSEIYVKMQYLPTSRFKRIVVRTTLDLVVSLGGTAGLFIGASILSIVEIIYLLCFGDNKA